MFDDLVRRHRVGTACGTRPARPGTHHSRRNEAAEAVAAISFGIAMPCLRRPAQTRFQRQPLWTHFATGMCDEARRLPKFHSIPCRERLFSAFYLGGYQAAGGFGKA